MLQQTLQLSLTWLVHYQYESSLLAFAGIVLITQVSSALAIFNASNKSLTADEQQRATFILSRYVPLGGHNSPQTVFALQATAFKTDNTGGQDTFDTEMKGALNMSTYTVRPGDSLSAVAAHFNLSLESLMFANPSTSAGQVIHAGDQLTIPSRNADAAQLATLSQERKAVAPPKTKFASIPFASVASDSTSSFLIPVQYKYISQYFSLVHPAFDMPAEIGTNIIASKSGCVVGITSGYGGGYGRSILEDVGDGYTARYAHLSGIAPGIEVGSCVSAGTLIGYVGSTGHSTGPHLHFEVRHNGAIFNPFPNLHP